MAAQPTRPSSGASGPAYATPQPRIDPIPAASTSGPTTGAMRAAWEAYAGHFAGPLTPLQGQPDLNVIANRCGPIVRTGVDFLFGPILKVETKAGGDAQAILDAVWGDDDKRMTLLSKTKINGGVYGHVFVKIVTPKNKQPMSADNPPRLVVQNPEMYSVTTDPDDCDLVTCYACTWRTADDCWHKQETKRVDPDDPDLDEGNNYNDPVQSEADADAHWEIQNYVKYGDGGNDAGTWEPDGPVMLWPYPFAPIVDWQNYPNPNDHWGAPDIDESVTNLNKQLHLVESNTNSVQYSHGHPWLFSTGADTGGITPTPGAITDLGSPDAKITAITASGDLANQMAFAAQIRADMDEASSTPGVATGRIAEMPKGPIPGISIRLMYGPRLMRTEHERRLYGSGIRELSQAVLILCGQKDAAADDILLNWQDPLPQDDLAMAQYALALDQLGVSKHTIFSEIGQDYDTEQELLKQEAKDSMRAALQGQALPGAGGVPFSAGQGMPPVVGQPGANATAQANPGPSGQPQNTPPVNHPAAVQQRAATAAVARVMRGKGGQ